MAKGFKDPLDEEADEAEGKAVGKHAAELGKRIGAARDEEPEVFTPEEPKDLDDEPEEVDETAPSRRDKRAARQSARERAAAAEARAQVLQEQLEATRGGAGASREAPQVNNAAAHAEQEYGQVLNEQEALFKEYHARANLTEAEDREYRRRAAVLDLKKTRAALRVDEAYNAPQRAQNDRNNRLAAKHPDVFGNQRALQYAAGEVSRRLARGDAETDDLHDAVMEEARQVILGKRPPPDAAQRARATGLPTGARGAPAGERSTFAMPKGGHDYRMAIAMFPNLEPAQACQKWVNVVGKKLQGARR